MKNRKSFLMLTALILIGSLLLSACTKKSSTTDRTNAVGFGTEKESTEEDTTASEETADTAEATAETSAAAEEESAEESSSSVSGQSDPADLAGETFSCEKFSAVCPEGWTNNPVKDFWDKEKMDPQTLQFIKGTPESDYDLYRLSSVRITCYEKTTTILDSRDSYENIEDETVTDSEGRDWVGFSGDYSSYRNFSLIAETEDNYFLATGLLNGSKSEFSLTDEDFIAILSSVRANEAEEESSEEETTEEDTTEENTTEEDTTEENTTEEDTTEEDTTEEDTTEAETTEEETTEEETTEEDTTEEDTTEEDTTEEETTEEDTTEEDTTEEDTTEARAPYKASENVSVEYSDGFTKLQVTFTELPTSVEDLEACVEEFGHNEMLTAAWFIAAMREFADDPEEARNMIAYLCDPDEASSVTSFVSDQIHQKPYLSYAYFAGADTENDFTPDEPFVVSLSDFDSHENNSFTYVRVACDSDERERTIAMVEDDVVGYRVVKCPALLLGIN